MTRREFLAKGSAIAGLSTAIPGLVAGCSPDLLLSLLGLDEKLPRGPRERRTIHFDHSLAGVTDLTLHVFGSTSHRVPLIEHTAESRERHRGLNSLLHFIADHQLTHYVEDVDLPADNLQHVLVFGRHVETGARVWVGSHIHVPGRALAAFAASDRMKAARPQLTAKMRRYGMKWGRDRAQTVNDLHNFLTPLDTATSLVFQHPEIMSLDDSTGALIHDLIQSLPCDDDPNCTPFIGALAVHIAEHWPADTSTGGWATLVPQTDVDGNPVLGGDGNAVYEPVLSDATNEVLATVVSEVKKVIFDDERFRGKNWQYTPSTAAVHNAAAPTAKRLASAFKGASGMADAGFRIDTSTPIGESHHGIKIMNLKVVDSTSRLLEIKLKNVYLRYLAVHAQYFAGDGNTYTALPVTDPTSNDTSRAKLLGYIPSNVAIFGVPVQDDLLAANSTLRFTVPEAATRAKLILGSLGVGGDPFCPEAIHGAIATIVINIGVPTFLLALGVGTAVKTDFSELFTNENTRKLIIEIVKVELLKRSLQYTAGIFGDAASISVKTTIQLIANAGIKGLLAAAPNLLFRYVESAAVFEALPIVGMAMRAIALLADAAAIAVSVGEVLSNPPLYEINLDLQMDTQIIIKKDPTDFRLPATARKLKVQLTYGGASPRIHTQAIGEEEVNDITLNFQGVPAGGTVDVEVSLLTDADVIVGYKLMAGIENGPGKTDTIEVEIKEIPPELTPDTQYHHDLQLQYDAASQKRIWVETPAPTETLAALCQGEDDRLCGLNGVTINQITGMLGYGFKAGGQVPGCAGGGTGILNTVQNINLGPDPNNALKIPACRFARPAGIVYDRLGGANGRHFYLEPNAAGSFDLRAITLAASPETLGGVQLTWGRFTQPVDSLVVNASWGYVVGVARDTHKIEILRLPPVAIDDGASPPEAIPFGFLKAGYGRRVGLLSQPVAVAIMDGMVLVLENGNRRIQCFNATGSPVEDPYSIGPVVPLKDEGPGVTYLDLGVDGAGYMFVLSYLNNGTSPSDYRLDVYKPGTSGQYLSRTTGVAAARFAVDTFRNVYTLNYATMAGAPTVEPTISQWTPQNP